MSIDDAQGGALLASSFAFQDVRFIGSVPGRYALMGAAPNDNGRVPVHACRLSSISTRVAVLFAPAIGKRGEAVIAHFDAFGVVRGRINRPLSAGFVLELELGSALRERLGRRIAWHRKLVQDEVVDQREHKRIQLRNPSTVITLADGSTSPALVIDVSRSGIALSSKLTPNIGMPLAVGKVVGRVVRHFDVGFAVKFIELQDMERIADLLRPFST